VHNIPNISQMNPSVMPELFAARAYGRHNTTTKPTTDQSAPSSRIQPQRRERSTRHIHPIGWGPLAESIVADTQPTVENTARRVRPMTSPTEIEAGLLARISRGRELALYAVECDERGDVVSARQLYMDALYILVPACRDLDRGPNSSRSARSREMKKMQELASVMLDRCEAFRSLDR